MSSGALLCVFAHQDDEYGVAARLAREGGNGRRVLCAFLTNGAARVPASIRDEESRGVLQSVGVRNEDMFFLGSAHDVPDGALVEHLEPALRMLEEAVVGREVGEVLTLAWEGGHQDHDAAHLVAVAFARRHGLRCREFPLYRAGPFGHFRVMSPLRSGGETTRLTLREAIRASMLVWRYRSQRTTWLGLLGGAFLTLVVLRRAVVQDVDPSRLRDPPCPRPLLYERRFRYPWERFSACAQPFIEAHLRTASPAPATRRTVPEGVRRD
jgi:LmbE family N-acetylglucosaminyl deacetylase